MTKFEIERAAAIVILSAPHAETLMDTYWDPSVPLEIRERAYGAASLIRLAIMSATEITQLLKEEAGA